MDQMPLHAVARLGFVYAFYRPAGSTTLRQLAQPESGPKESFWIQDCKIGERGRNRTFNLLIKSQLLCQLSYAPLLWNQSDEGHHRKQYQCNTGILPQAPQANSQRFNLLFIWR